MQNQKTTNITIENKKSVLRILEHNILHILYADNIVLEIKDINELYTSYNALPDPRPLKVLSEMGDFISITTEARNYGAEISPDLTKLAYVVKGLSQRLLLKFYIKMMKRKKPTKVFNNFDAAYAWLIEE